MKIITPFLLLFSFSILASAAETSTKKKAPAKETPKTEAAAAQASAKAKALSKSLTAAQCSKLLEVLNEGDEKALMNLPGLGASRAAAVKKARPFADPADLVKVSGIGDETLAEIVAHAKAGFPEAKKKEEPSESKAEAKKKAPAKPKPAAKKKTAEAEPDKAKE